MKKLMERPTWLARAKCSRYASFAWGLTPHLFAACTVAMILSLPVFPSQDGPVHLYYVDVLRNLLAHTGPYAQYFEIRSYITPYMFEYYALLGLEQVFSPILSEKLLICAYVLTFILSFRYLLGSVTERPTPWALGGALFCLNFYVQMGFLNYAFGTALVFLLAGYWLRWKNHLTVWRIVALSGGFLLLVFTHPLPPAVFLCFAALNLLVCFVLERKRDPRSTSKETLRNLWRPIVTVFLMGAVAGAWILHFSDSRPVPPRAEKTLGILYRVIRELSFGRITPIHFGVLQLVLICPVFIITVALIAAFFKRRGSLGATPVTLAIFTIIFFAVSCLAPENMLKSGAYFFSDRFSIYWIMFLITAAASLKPSSTVTNRIGIAALLLAIVVLPIQWIDLSRTAHNLIAALQVPLMKPGSLGVIITDEDANDAEVVRPFMWAGVHLFRESQAILTNAPWMDFKFIMLRPKFRDSWTYEDHLQYVPMDMLNTLNNDGKIPMDFVVRFDPDGQHTWDVTQRLGLPLLAGSPRLAFYARSSAIREGLDR